MEAVLTLLGSSGHLDPAAAVHLGCTSRGIWNSDDYWKAQWCSLNLGAPNLARDGLIVVKNSIEDISRWTSNGPLSSAFQLHFQIIDAADPVLLQRTHALARSVESILCHTRKCPERLAFFLSSLARSSVLGHNLIFLERMYVKNVVSKTALKHALANQLALPDFAGCHFRRPFLFLFIHLFPNINEVFAYGFRLFLSIDPSLLDESSSTSCPLASFLKRPDFNATAYELFQEAAPKLWDVSLSKSDTLAEQCELSYPSPETRRQPTSSPETSPPNSARSQDSTVGKKAVFSGDHAMLSITFAVKAVFTNRILETELTDATHLLKCLERMFEWLGSERCTTALLGLYREDPRLFKPMRRDVMVLLSRWIGNEAVTSISTGRPWPGESDFSGSDASSETAQAHVSERSPIVRRYSRIPSFTSACRSMHIFRETIRGSLRRTTSS